MNQGHLSSKQIIKTSWNNEHSREVFLDENGLRLKEMSVFDISQLDWKFRRYSYEDILSLYKFIGSSIGIFIRNFLPSARIIHGIDNVIEFRIANHNTANMIAFKNFLVETAIKELKLEEQKTTLNLLESIPIVEDGITNRFLETLQQRYAHYGPIKGSEHLFPLYSTHEGIYGKVWDKVQQLGDSYIFIAHAAVPFMIGFYLRTKNSRIFLAEKHMTTDPYKHFRRHQLDENILIPFNDVEYRYPIIIDKAYTGRTLKSLKQEFPNARTVALSPKTRMAIQNSDYFTFNDCFFEKKDVDMHDPNWHLTLLEKSLRGEPKYGN